MNEMKVFNPANGECLASVKADNAESIKNKAARAREAWRNCRLTALSTRCAAIEKFSQALLDRVDELAATLSSETGKPITQAGNEIKATKGRIDFFLENVGKVLREEQVRPAQSGTEEILRREPLGVIANISAWNYPYFVGANVYVPALLAGNAVLYKPSELSSLTGQKVESLLHGAGVPKDIFIGVYGNGAAGAHLLEQPIDGVFFTGSYATGRKIAEAVAQKMIPVQLELGGKDPVYVCEDVEVEKAAAAVADGAFYNTGQSCCAVERVYVHSSIAERFIAEFVRVVKTMEVGEPASATTYIGPLTRSEQIPVLEAQVSDALSKGAVLLSGGKRRDGKGNYFEPTVLGEVNHSMSVMREESFGPIIGIQVVQSDEQALELMNDTEYGLTAGVYTRDRGRAERILNEVNAGSVYWNCCDRVSPFLPWSGRGHSGIGATLGIEGIRCFTRPKGWHMRG